MVPGEIEREEVATRRMGFVSVAGRILFAFFCLFSANEDIRQFGSDGGPAAKEPKFNLFVKQVSTYTGMAVPHVQIKTIIIALVYLRAVGAPLFILYSSSSFGVLLLLLYLAFITPVMYDFYNYDLGSPQFMHLFTQFLQIFLFVRNLALYGSLLFYLGMKNSIPRRYSKKKRGKTNIA